MLAQDIIITKDNERIEVNVLMEYDAVIQYRFFKTSTDSTYLIPKAKINTITYKSGKVVSFEDFNPTPLTTTITAQAVTQTDPIAKSPVRNQNEFIYLVKFKPLATIIGAITGMFDFEVAVVHYVHPKIGIPVELQIAYYNKLFGVVLMSGIEAVPATHREKSGLYLNYEIGGIFVAGIFGLCTGGHLGYQLVTKKGLVFTPALGVQYETISNKVGLHLMFDIGFAIKRK